MLENPYVLYPLLGLLFIATIYGYVKLLRIRNSPDGERLLRQRAQGPFVPLSREDIAEDEQRKKK